MFENKNIEELLHKSVTKKTLITDLCNSSLVLDVLQIMNVYVAKMNGLRRYKKKFINFYKSL